MAEVSKQRVTVNDVAAHAGVSQATVSQVLNGSRPVAPATRARVEASIEALGYRPNQFARALRGQKSRTVAVILPDFVQEAYPWAVAGVSEVLRPEGYQVALYTTGGDPAAAAEAAQSVAERATDGAIVFGYPLDPADARALAEAGTAVVNASPGAVSPDGCDTVRVDQAAGFDGLVRLLGERYDGLMAHIAGPPDDPASGGRAAGFRTGLESFGTPEDEIIVAPAAAATWAAGRDTAAALLARYRRPRILVCADDRLALGALAAARERGLRVPHDLAVSGYGNLNAAALAVPPLTTLDPVPAAQGRAAARLLLERLAGADAGPPRHLVLPAEVVERESA